MTPDPFRTAELRSAVLAAWSQSPARLREDSNTEEDHARGYYRDRVVVELAQNAADAAARAGVPGQLMLALIEDGTTFRLVVANTGTGIDVSGVASLSSLRASAKTADEAQTVGRFGVGFAAVRSVSDDITVASRDGGVRFSLDQTRAALAEISSLSEQVAARFTALAILRLPHPAPAHDGGRRPAPDSPERSSRLDLGAYDTVITLTLRDEEAVAAVRAQLAAIDDALLLALPTLAAIRIDDGHHTRVLSDAASRWLAVTRVGTVPAGLLADRPIEERTRAAWSLTWAYPRTPEVAVLDPVIHAPTPTDEPLSLPALLLATFPLDPSRRHIAEGDLTQFLVAEAGRAYAELAAQVPDPLDLVPAGLPRARVDAEICAVAVTALQAAPIFSGRLAADTVVIDTEVSADLVDALAPTGLGVVPVGRGQLSAARRLGVQVLSLADVIDALPAGLAPGQWHALYTALEPHADQDRSVREALTAIFVPCADGTTARGPRGLVLPGTGDVPALDGLHVVHPEAVHPLLLRLGAVADNGPAVLGLAAVEHAVREAADSLLDTDVSDDGPSSASVAAILALVAQVSTTHRDPGDLPNWLAGLPLPGDEGTWQRADELSWPGSWADQHFDLPAVDPSALPGGTLTAEVARALGVRLELAAGIVEHETGQVNDATRVAGWSDYDDYLCAVLGENHDLGALSVITDLDVVDDDSWPAVLDLIADDPDMYRAVVGTVRTPGAANEALSYTAWYLRDVFGAPWTTTDALAAVLPDRPAELAGVRDAGLLRALGAVASAADLTRLLTAPDPATWEAFWTGLPNAGTAVTLPVASAVWAAFERASAAGLELDPPDVVIALHGLTLRVVAAEDMVVTHAPMWAQIRAVLPATDPEAAERMARALD